MLTAKGKCVKMSNMKTVTVRQVQHHLSEVLREVSQGHEVQVVKRKRVVAKIIPASQPPRPRRWPDFESRRRRLFGGKKLPGGSLSEIILKSR